MLHLRLLAKMRLHQAPQQQPHQLQRRQLLQLLQQLSPQSLPERNDGLPLELKDLIESLNQSDQSRPGDSQQSQTERLRELLSNSGLSPDDIERIQRSVQNNSMLPDGQDNNRARSGNNGRPSTAGSSGTARRDENELQPSPSARAPGRLPGASNQLPRGVRNGTTPGSIGSGASYEERQRMLRQAFGIDPKPSTGAPSESRRNGSLSSRMNQQPAPGTQPRLGADQTEPDSGVPDLTSRNQPGGRRPGKPAPADSPDGTSINPAARQSRSSSAPENSESGTTPRPALDSSPNGTGTQTTSTPGESESSTSARTTNENQSERQKKLNEIADSDRPVWQKFQQIAQVARREATERIQQHGSKPGDSEKPSGRANGFTEKLASVVQDAAVATLGTMSEFSHEPGSQRQRNGRSQSRRNQPEPEVRQWASSVNEWIARLPESNGGDSTEAEPATESNPDTADSDTSYSFWLVIILFGGGLWWYLRRQGEATSSSQKHAHRPTLRPNATERERLIHSFHELLRRSNCGSEEWWNHSRAVNEFARKRPRLAPSIQELAAIYEQARYAPDSEPSPEQLAAARSALKQCGQR